MTDSKTTEATTTPAHDEAPDATTAEPTAPRRGRAPVGPQIKMRVPAWVLDQVDALQAHRAELEGKSVPKSDVIRDVMRAGLIAMKREGVEAPGFNPAQAIIAARQKSEAI